MIPRICQGTGLAFLLALITSMHGFAKGGFAFISIAGPGIEAEIRATELKLTEDFFAFADFYRDRVEAPADPGEGYQIRRYYIDGKREIVFDQLHYYPSTGFVFYDGIVNGESEYDGEWYSANPAAKAVFESALPVPLSARVQNQPAAEPVKELRSAASKWQSPPAVSPFPFDVVIPAAVLAGLLAVLALRLRKPVPQ